MKRLRYIVYLLVMLFRKGSLLELGLKRLELRHLLLALPLLLSLSLLTGCALQPVPFSEAEVFVTLSDSDAIRAGYNGYTVKLTNIATYRSVSDTTDFQGKVHFTAEEGIYNVEVTGTKTLTTTVGLGQTFLHSEHIRGLKEKVEVLGSVVTDTIPLMISQQGNGFVIKEIYYTGSKTPSNGSYYQDQFIEVFNNSDSVLYADGLTIVESTHISNAAVYPYSDRPNDLIAGALYSVPGTGLEHPVLPGSSIVLASLGINHKTANANSPVDLSGADFEWYDAGIDVDVPEVPNLIRAFCYSNTIWIFHVKGYHAYALIQPAEGIANFVTAHSISVLTTSGSSVTRVAVPYSMIQDGVELGTAGTIGSKALASSVDVSFTFCDGSYIGKSVRRKVLKWENGRAFLQDTNNSASDFISNATPKPGEVE